MVDDLVPLVGTQRTGAGWAGKKGTHAAVSYGQERVRYADLISVTVG